MKETAGCVQERTRETNFKFDSGIRIYYDNSRNCRS